MARPTHYRSPSGEIKAYRNDAGYKEKFGGPRPAIDRPQDIPEQQGGGGGGAPRISAPQQAPNLPGEAYLNPNDFLKLARIQAEANVPDFTPDIPRLRDVAKQQTSPFFEQSRNVLDVHGSIAQQQAQISQGRIARSFDDAYEELQESYNQRGLFFSGEELEAEGDLLQSRAEQLSLSDLNLQKMLANIEAKKGELSLQEKKAVEDMFQTLLTSEESVYNKQREAAVNRMIANVVPSFVESKGALENFKLSSKQRSRQISDELNLQTLDVRSQTAPLDLALKLAKVENLPIDRAVAESELAVQLAEENRIPIEDALQITKLERERFKAETLDPLTAQKMQANINSSMRKLQLGFQDDATISNLADGLLLGQITPERLYSSARNTKIADDVLKTTYVKAMESTGQSFPFDVFLEEMQAVNQGFGSEYLNIAAESASKQVP